MSEDDKLNTSNTIGLILLVIALVLFLLFGAGLIWSQNDLPPDQPVSSVNFEDEHVSSDEIVQPKIEAESNDSLATAAAPLMPTAVSTSVPVVTKMSLPTFDNPVNEQYAEEAASWGADYLPVSMENSGAWQYETNSFLRPIALEVDENSAYLLDGGRVMALDLTNTDPPEVLLIPGDDIGGVHVLEPLDLALMGEILFVLDRAGDVYRYDTTNNIWELDRYDRPVEESSGHYFVAIDTPNVSEGEPNFSQSRTLLETNYKFAMQYGGDDESLWNLPDGRSVDVSMTGDDVFVLQREMFDSSGIVTKYNDTRSIKSFSPKIQINTPRQVVATEQAVFVLDDNGYRLLALDPINGKLLQILQLPQNDPISVFAVDPDGQFVLAGRDRLYFVDEPEQIAAIPGGQVLEGVQPHDPSFLQDLDDFTVPIGGSNITFRDFQMPGAPRHYRLGVHEGLDFYWQPGTKVLAAADGVVIRADSEYIGPTALELASWWNQTQETGFTTREILNKYLGRQVWIQHENGLVTRYAHLRSVEPGIEQGGEVIKGQMIGEVGNSGSPASLESEKSDAHLHFELWLEDSFLGQFLRPIETREFIERLLPPSNSS